MSVPSTESAAESTGAGSTAAGPAPASEGTRALGPISVVVVNYQGEDYLEPCLRSIEAQTHAPDEVLVVENASTDGSLNVLNTHFRGVEIVRMPTNVGACTARNVGMRAAKYRFVLLVDNDVILAPDTLERLVAAMSADPGAVMAQPRSVYKADNARIHYDGGDLHYAGLISLHNFGAERPADPPPVEEIDVAISLALLVDKAEVIQAGGFDEVFFILFEDLDLSHRLRLAGKRILKINDAVVQHDAGTPGISFRDDSDYPGRRVFFHSRNRWLYMVKCFRLWTLLVSLPGLLVYEAAWFLFALKAGNAGHWLKGKVAFFRGFKEAWRKRKHIQRRRTVGDRALLVGGPLTLSPNLAASKGLGARMLDGALRGWWAICRWLVF
ncbi:MAG: glycosyltransferase family 2 protein [Planctomycetota bacterium]